MTQIRGDDEARFWSHVDKTGPVSSIGRCWLWTGAVAGWGYAQIGFRNPDRRVMVHRYSFELHGGLLLDGMHIDHLCRVKLCVNPAHLEQVTPRENVIRSGGLAAQQLQRLACPQGHPYFGDNLMVDRGRRRCRTCLSRQRHDRYVRTGK